ncbi:phosphate signaling complex PhoU family protein [Desulfurococcus amylolyticus]|uniref:Phosphate uptake regulator, PhoU n=1 Tax=Desulfurococcus amylolyticus DSM 16532 TaxID=768672 RepID=I3XQ57_DESAM|nr:phosphate uptake regulator PhoU [Desulfurococcus amylolyticus]AFL66081.1 phosphate uptake regulator, PhoU [Desulfurococcus amylolyticus DSM 16532]
MYKRKLQKMGVTSLGISLPKKWLHYYNLKQGDEVEVEILPDYTLLVRPSFIKGNVGYNCQTLRYDGEAVNESIMRLISLYVNGVDSIKVVCGDQCETFKESIYRVLERNVIGLEIIEEGRDYVMLACLVDILSLPLSEVLRKMSMLIPALLRDLKRNMETNTLLDMEERDSLIDKLYLYAIRQLNMVLHGRLLLDKTGLKSMGEAVSIANLLKILERMGDHIVLLHRWYNNARGKKEVVDNVVILLNEVIPITEKILNSYLAILENPSKIPSIEKTLSELRIVEEKIKSSTLDAGPLISLTRMIAYLRDIIEVVTDIVVSRKLGESACEEGKLVESYK